MITTLIEREAEPILISELTWREFKAVEQLIERPGLRLSFLDGVLEIQKMPGKKHETIKKRIASLVEIYLEFLELDFTPTGSVTLESEYKNVKKEGDESYELGANRKGPDLVIEVVVSSSRIDKLEAYKRLQIPEVRFFINQKNVLFCENQLTIYFFKRKNSCKISGIYLGQKPILHRLCVPIDTRFA